MLRWARCRSYQKRAGTCYAKLVVLHLSGSVGHVVRFGASGRETSAHYFLCLDRSGVDPTKTTVGQVMPKLCFCILCDVRVT
jgi:hypothetical protein